MLLTTPFSFLYKAWKREKGRGGHGVMEIRFEYMDCQL